MNPAVPSRSSASASPGWRPPRACRRRRRGLGLGRRPAGASRERDGIAVDRSRRTATGRGPRRWSSAPASPITFPSPHPVAAKAAAAGCPIIGDVELLFRAQPRARYRRHHRHQRQIDHHRADRPSSWRGPARAVEVGGNLGTPALALAAADAGRHLCPRDVVLSARADAERALRRRRAAQHHARPSRPPWRHGGLRRRQARGSSQHQTRRRSRRSSASTTTPSRSIHGGRSREAPACRADLVEPIGRAVSRRRSTGCRTPSWRRERAQR